VFSPRGRIFSFRLRVSICCGAVLSSSIQFYPVLSSSRIFVHSSKHESFTPSFKILHTVFWSSFTYVRISGESINRPKSIFGDTFIYCPDRHRHQALLTPTSPANVDSCALSQVIQTGYIQNVYAINQVTPVPASGLLLDYLQP
jgi:hypothetical protein